MTGVNKFGGARFGDSMPLPRLDEHDLRQREGQLGASFRASSMGSHDSHQGIDRLLDTAEEAMARFAPPAEDMSVQPTMHETRRLANPFELKTAINSERVLRAMIRSGVHPGHMTPGMLRQASDSIAAAGRIAVPVAPVPTQSVHEAGAEHLYDVAPPMILPARVPSSAIMGNPGFFARCFCRFR